MLLPQLIMQQGYHTSEAIVSVNIRPVAASRDETWSRNSSELICKVWLPNKETPGSLWTTNQNNVARRLDSLMRSS
jgi:hypothetical protein